MQRTLATVLLTALALGTAAACSPLHGAGRVQPGDTGAGYDHALQPVPNPALAGQRAHGWRYFSDPARHRAVVISPQGDYYLNPGRQDLRWVAGAQDGG